MSDGDATRSPSSGRQLAVRGRDGSRIRTREIVASLSRSGRLPRSTNFRLRRVALGDAAIGHPIPVLDAERSW